MFQESFWSISLSMFEIEERYRQFAQSYSDLQSMLLSHADRFFCMSAHLTLLSDTKTLSDWLLLHARLKWWSIKERNNSIRNMLSSWASKDHQYVSAKQKILTIKHAEDVEIRESSWIFRDSKFILLSQRDMLCFRHRSSLANSKTWAFALHAQRREVINSNWSTMHSWRFQFLKIMMYHIHCRLTHV